ncbi:MAG: UDP-N-acetylmuramate--L-alanine ligase [Hyphomicrobiales bacterium]|nr:UDP-N-acetylmuramate--L-alanine ligase [Hyphomicrobiales bacterium]MCY4032412.1 UDP-N-acetylmuramate--L-alanine ligase [Hyphomicrobiales bacterium]MCY4038412.1 UDP-N-acetylmuramate--L-alanine ligase [Hyphomicrobiales bacterium]
MIPEQHFSQVEHVHFVGIGGIGMSGIAEVMHNLGYKVHGSDVAENSNTRRLRDLGISIDIGHKAENITNAQILVTSSAIKDNNIEIEEARRRFLPVIPRPQMLAELMRLKSSIAIAGTHGKTTTTSMVATLIDAAGFDPTIINGGIINAYNTNGRLGAGEWMVVEADESDGSLASLHATIAVVTNIDPEHLDHYGDFDALRAAFKSFVQNIPFYGTAILCVDHPEVQFLLGQLRDRRLITYGFSQQADVQARCVGESDDGRPPHEVLIRDRQSDKCKSLGIFKPPMIGAHNISNALAAIAVATQLDIKSSLILETLATFSGVRRRFTLTGTWNGIDIHDDYAHHPVEIKATLEAARGVCKGNLIAIAQPHRYTRLQELWDSFLFCFDDADIAVIMPVYAAGEKAIDGCDNISFAAALSGRGHRNAIAISAPDDIAPFVARTGKPGDMVVVLGAGNSTIWANELPQQLSALRPGSAHA